MKLRARYVRPSAGTKGLFLLNYLKQKEFFGQADWHTSCLAIVSKEEIVTKRLAVLVLSLISIVGVASPSSAISLSYTDTITCSAGVGPACGGNAITYALNYSSNPGTATFTISNSGSTTPPSWYVGWAIFQFDQSVRAGLSSLVPPAGTGPWTLSDGSLTNPNVQVLTGGGNYNQLLPGGKVGFVVTSLIQGNTPDITQGWFVNDTAGTGTFTFNYNLASGTLNTSAINFLVGYYDGLNGSGNRLVNQLSATLVPEPGTLVLLGTGLVTLGILGRKKKFFNRGKDF